MNSDLNDFLLKIKDPLELTTVLNHCKRIEKILGENNIMKLLDRLYETKSIQLLNKIGNDELLEYFKGMVSQIEKKNP